MADPVEITGVAWSGSLPRWATEQTQKSILKALQANSSYNSNQVKTLEKLLKAVTASGSAFDKDVLNDLSKNIRANNKELVKESDIRKAENKGRSGANKSLFDMGKTLGKTTGILSILYQTLGKQVLNAFFAQLNNYDKLIKSGIQFSDSLDRGATGMATLANVIQSTGTTYKNFADAVKDHTQAVHIYGVKRFGKTVETMRKDMMGLGLTNRETTEYLAEYLDMQRMFGMTQQMNNISISRSAQEAYESIASWSVMLGKSRDQIKKGMEQQTQDADIQGFIRNIADPKLAAQVAENYKNLAGAIPDDEVRSMFNRFLTSSNAQAEELYQIAAMTGNAQLTDSLMKLRENINTGNMSMQDMATIMRDLGDASATSYDSLTLMRSAGVAGADTMIKFNNVAALTAEAMERQAKVNKNDPAIRARERFNKQLERLQSTFERVIGGVNGSVSMLDLFTSGLEFINNVIDNNKENIQSFIGKLVEGIQRLVIWISELIDPKTRDKALESMKKFLVAGVKGFFSILGTAINEGFKAFFSDMSLTDILMKTSVAGLAYTALKKPKETGQALSSIGKGAVSLGKKSFDFGKSIFASVGGFINNLGKSISGTGGKFLPNLLKGIAGFIKRIPIIGPLIFGTYEGLKDAIGEDGPWYKKLLAGLLGFASGIVKSFINLPTMIVDALFGTDLTGFISEMFETVKSKIKGFFGWLGSLFSDDDDEVAEVAEAAKSAGTAQERKRIAREQAKPLSTVPTISEIQADTLAERALALNREADNFKDRSTMDINTILNELIQVNEQILAVLLDNNKKQTDLVRRVGNNGNTF